MISVYLCDDEPIWLNRLHKAIVDYQIKSDWELAIAHQTTSPEQLLHYLSEHPPLNGIYFLDIDFKASMDGLDLAKQIRNIDPHASIVFVTTHDEMVMETFRLKLEVLDYIIKDGASLTEQLCACLLHLEEKYLTNAKASSPAISIHVASTYHTIFPQNIYYVETVKNAHKLSIHLESAIYHIPESLSSLRSRLDDNFVQCHKACLVNVFHIAKLDSTNRQIILDNGDCCSCSVREWKKLVRKYQDIFIFKA